MKALEKYFDYNLVDDGSSFGGTAFENETVRDFVEEVGAGIETLEQLNEALANCGILPVEE